MVTQVFLSMPHAGGWRTEVEQPGDTLRRGPAFPEGAHKALASTQMRRNLGHATRTIRSRRTDRVAEMSDWEGLRNTVGAVKFRVASRLPELLGQSEVNVTARGGIVHWARDAVETNRIITDIIASRGVDNIVKVKPMATQETNLNEYLADRGITAHETDLAEMIVQLVDDMSSHIVVSTIHRNHSEVRGVFLGHMEDAPADLSDDSEELTAAAHLHLHNKSLHASVAVSGTNMGVAETGTVSIFESKDNGRMYLTLPDTLVTLMGIEKLVPRSQDVEIFSQLLPRSAADERMNPYTSMRTGVTEGDSPKEFHLMLMNNGCTKTLADSVGCQTPTCVRCRSYMNVYPVYQHTGEHACSSAYPGPIGSIIVPRFTQELADDDPVHTLPFTSSLCGTCGKVCSVKIGISTILIHLQARSMDVERHTVSDVWGVAMSVSVPVMSKSSLRVAASQTVKASALLSGKEGKIGALPFLVSLWAGARDLPVAPSETFRQWWKRTHPKGETPLSQIAGAQSGRGRADGFPAGPPPPSSKPVSGSTSADGEPAPAALDTRSAINNPEPITLETSAIQAPAGSTNEKEL